VDEIRYLGVHIVSSLYLNVVLISLNVLFIDLRMQPVFGRIGQIASEKVIIQLVVCSEISAYTFVWY
jgi:hypothetical protein